MYSSKVRIRFNLKQKNVFKIEIYFKIKVFYKIKVNFMKNILFYYFNDINKLIKLRIIKYSSLIVFHLYHYFSFSIRTRNNVLIDTHLFVYFKNFTLIINLTGPSKKISDCSILWNKFFALLAIMKHCGHLHFLLKYNTAVLI